MSCAECGSETTDPAEPCPGCGAPPTVVLGKGVLAEPEALALLADGLGGNADVASAAGRLSQPYLDQARWNTATGHLTATLTDPAVPA